MVVSTKTKLRKHILTNIKGEMYGRQGWQERQGKKPETALRKAEAKVKKQD
jgi:hypothetical protein